MAKRLLIACLFILIATGANAGPSPKSELLNNIKVISYNRKKEEALSFILFVMGLPEKVFRYCDYDILFYPELSTSLVNGKLKNVYVVVHNGEITDIKVFPSDIDPYNEFDTYP